MTFEAMHRRRTPDSARRERAPVGGTFDWNLAEPSTWNTAGVEFHDETLRDGVQGPSITDPPLEAKIAHLEDAEALGIHSIDLGLPGAGPRAMADVRALARHIEQNRIAISPQCAARTHVADVRPILDIAMATGLTIEVAVFIGASPIRQYVEGWDLDYIRRLARDAIELAQREGLPVLFATEDTTRSRPETLSVLYRTAIDLGVGRIALCDTVGASTPDGARALVHWTRGLIAEMGADVRIDWHGHEDRGLGVVNALAAAAAGAHRIHGTALGIGERVGNTALDLCLLYCDEAGHIDLDHALLGAWCRRVSRACAWPIPRFYPVDYDHDPLLPSGQPAGHRARSESESCP